MYIQERAVDKTKPATNPKPSASSSPTAGCSDCDWFTPWKASDLQNDGAGSAVKRDILISTEGGNASSSDSLVVSLSEYNENIHVSAKLDRFAQRTNLRKTINGKRMFAGPMPPVLSHWALGRIIGRITNKWKR